MSDLEDVPNKVEDKCITHFIHFQNHILHSYDYYPTLYIIHMCIQRTQTYGITFILFKATALHFCTEL